MTRQSDEAFNAAFEAASRDFRTSFKPMPGTILDGPPSTWPKGLSVLRRHYCVALVQGEHGSLAAMSLGQHHGTVAGAMRELAGHLEMYPNAGVTSVALGFDVEDPEQARAYNHLLDDAGRQAQEMQQ